MPWSSRSHSRRCALRMLGFLSVVIIIIVIIVTNITVIGLMAALPLPGPNTNLLLMAPSGSASPCLGLYTLGEVGVPEGRGSFGAAY